MARSSKIVPVATGVTKDGERNDCVVRAITNVSGQQYDTVHSLLKKHGRKDCKGTYWNTTESVMTELGYECLYMGTNKMALWYGKAKGKAYESKSVSLGKLVKDLPKGKYVVYIRGHATALVDGQLIDTFPNNANSRVMAIFYDKSQFSK